MRPFRRKSTWDKVKDPIAARAPGRGTVKSGLLAAGAAVGITAVSSAVSSLRQKKDS